MRLTTKCKKCKNKLSLSENRTTKLTKVYHCDACTQINEDGEEAKAFLVFKESKDSRKQSRESFFFGKNRFLAFYPEEGAITVILKGNDEKSFEWKDPIKTYERAQEIFDQHVKWILF